jgi:DMSO/TMAO reductase YedYZ molybdopterin-dependent catalytic subunit
MNTMPSHPNLALTRRSFLDGLCRACAAFAVAGVRLPSRAFGQEGPSKDRLIVRSTRPQDLETPAHLLTSWITPVDLFYVRSHFYTPSIDAAAWALRIDGEVDRPRGWSLEEIKRAPAITMVATLECAGNGRAFFEPRVAGVQWEKGAVGTARWTGVRLADLLRSSGIRSSARYIWLDGADRGVGRAPDFVRSLAIDKAMHRDTLLVYAMNGEALPVAHGFPLRVIVPGWEGAYSVKWLTHIEASDRDHPGTFVQVGYRYPRRPVAPGTLVPAADTDPLTEMAVKSMMTSPRADEVVRRGPVRISGFAWAGEADIARVEISTDMGRTWNAARLGRDRAAHAWRQFDYTWRAGEAGSHTVLSRATDSRGRVQPDVAAWNPGGYLWNAIDRVRFHVERPSLVTDPAPGIAPAGDPPAASLLETRCNVCHDNRLVAQQRLDAAGWTREIDKMIGWGANVTDEEKATLARYLSSR